jgi:hypothetical protein
MHAKGLTRLEDRTGFVRAPTRGRMQTARIPVLLAMLCGLGIQFPPRSLAATLYVDSSCEDPSEPPDRRMLTSTVADALPGDQIILHAGTYPERLTINKRLTLTASGGPATVGQYPASEEDLAFHWAPVHYQDVDKSEWPDGNGDYILSIDRDGVWDVSLNWRPDQGGTFGSFPLEAWCYYSVVSTVTHHYITYLFYHAFDTANTPDAKNDMEGALFVIKRDTGLWGRLEAVITTYHSDLHAYFSPDTPLVMNCKMEDQGQCWIQWRDGRVMTSQQSGGHGFGCYPAYVHVGDDAVVYVPSTTTAGEPPGRIPDGTWVEVPYRLVDIHAPGGFWEHRYDPKVFKPDGGYLQMVGDHANPPWYWMDGDHDGNLCVSGDWTHDPALLAQYYFRLADGSMSPGDYFDRQYERNPYRADMDILTRGRARQFYCDPLMSLDKWIADWGGTCPRQSRDYPCQ